MPPLVVGQTPLKRERKRLHCKNFDSPCSKKFFSYYSRSSSCLTADQGGRVGAANRPFPKTAFFFVGWLVRRTKKSEKKKNFKCSFVAASLGWTHTHTHSHTWKMMDRGPHLPCFFLWSLKVSQALFFFKIRPWGGNNFSRRMSCSGFLLDLSPSLKQRHERRRRNPTGLLNSRA